MKRLIYTALIATIGTACVTEEEKLNRAEYIGESIADASMTELGYAAAIIKDVIDYNDYLTIESSDADESTKEMAWGALGYKSRTIDGMKHILTTEATIGNNMTTTTLTIDDVALGEGGRWTVERMGYKPYTMEITGEIGETGGYTVTFSKITVGDIFGNEHPGTAHFDVVYDTFEKRLYLDGNLSSTHHDKSELYPLTLTSKTTAPLCINLENKHFIDGATNITCSDQYYNTYDNAALSFLPDKYDLRGLPIVEIEYKGAFMRVGRNYSMCY